MLTDTGQSKAEYGNIERIRNWYARNVETTVFRIKSPRGPQYAGIRPSATAETPGVL